MTAVSGHRRTATVGGKMVEASGRVSGWMTVAGDRLRAAEGGASGRRGAQRERQVARWRATRNNSCFPSRIPSVNGVLELPVNGTRGSSANNYSEGLVEDCKGPLVLPLDAEQAFVKDGMRGDHYATFPDLGLRMAIGIVHVKKSGISNGEETCHP
ncbi:hypothetical protein GUJ93_ZPchr0015g6699 [Zizania palustris]|uniref:Uncharacterized protein n=1 Tax=Zizania palustris TaxID=103762 RepID=A0A8J5VSQ2_ZIZPA|nr:hypothetical protein GUJ93_ZPchr0015g6699 [Zizania palustris]